MGRRLQGGIMPPLEYFSYDANGQYGKPAAARLGRITSGVAGRKRSYKYAVRYYTKSLVGGNRVPRVPKSSYTEVKYLDAVINHAVDLTAPYSTGAICTVAGGSAQGQRVGNAIRVLGYTIGLEFTNGTGAAGGSSADETYRMVLAEGVTINSVSDPGISKLVVADGNGNTSPTSLRFFEAISDYRILEDKLVRVHAYLNVTNECKRVVEREVKCNFIQKYVGTAANQLNQNPVFMYFMNNITHTAGSLSNVQGYVRMKYCDV